MRLSNKRVTIWLVVTTWPAGLFSVFPATNEEDANDVKRDHKRWHPGAWVAIHKVVQALPEPPKEGQS